ncbi:hypothetical protein WG909_03860 [Peptostreptococcaceae bacterium AGR-M142]
MILILSISIIHKNYTKDYEIKFTNNHIKRAVIKELGKKNRYDEKILKSELDSIKRLDLDLDIIGYHNVIDDFSDLSNLKIYILNKENKDRNYILNNINEESYFYKKDIKVDVFNGSIMQSEIKTSNNGNELDINIETSSNDNKSKEVYCIYLKKVDDNMYIKNL